ncbi:MAG: metallophosphoesterase [Deltaproteobacteria bacterium]|nr:metallophosphoesterase [Deltaproteobacteria bacterium]
MADRYLIVSDLHLCDVEDHADGWKAYKSSRFVFDEELAERVARFAERAGPGDRSTLLLNGDVFDFDLVTAAPKEAPWPVSRNERKRGLAPNEHKSAWKLGRILEHHPGFVRMLVRFAAAGHRIVYVLGNHDRELHFPAVRTVLLDALRAAVDAGGPALPAEPIRFEDWFFYEPGRLYAEHGQQYDLYTSYRWILAPTYPRRGGAQLTIPMGNLSNRYLMSGMGFFNPHATDYILNLYRYLAHWFRHYAFSKHSLAWNWLRGSVTAVRALLRIKRKNLRRPADYDERLRAQAERSGVAPECLVALERLARPPITTRVFRIFREFWLDRVLLSGAMVLGTVVLALVPIPLWVKLMVPLTGFPLIFFVYELLAHGETVHGVESRLPSFARSIVELLPARVVVFGHTHRPRILPLGRGVQFVDSGTWAPIWDRGPERRLTAGYRNWVEVRYDGDDCDVALGAETDLPPPACRPSGAA